MGVTRRGFLRAGGLSLLASACAPTSLPAAAPGLPSRASAAGGDRRTVATSTRAYVGAPGDPLLVTVFLRGGADGLHLVPPFGDRGYERLRGSLSLSQTLPFAKGFGLHPELAALEPLVERGELAVVHAVGSPHPTRSHFEAQDFMEWGRPGAIRTKDGWLARALRDVAGENAFASLALTSRLPLTLRGSDAFAIDDPGRFGIPGASRGARAALVQMYAASGGDPVGSAGSRALDALAEVERLTGRRAAGRRRPTRRAGAQLSAAVEQLVALEAAGLPLRAVFLESSGWDTHQGQGTTSGAMARAVRDLGEAIARLRTASEGRSDWLIVVMTEFGRTVRPNGSRGTDHGHGSVMLVAGARVRGGLYGDWPGLDESRLYEGRDLPVTTDYRSVLTEVLRAHLGAPPPPDTFPDFAPTGLGLVA